MRDETKNGCVGDQGRLPFTRKTRKFWLANEMDGVNGKRPRFMAEREDNMDCIQDAVAS